VRGDGIPHDNEQYEENKALPNQVLELIANAPAQLSVKFQKSIRTEGDQTVGDKSDGEILQH